MNNSLFYIQKYYRQGKLYNEYRQKYGVNLLRRQKQISAMEFAGIKLKKEIAPSMFVYNTIEKIRTVDNNLAEDLLSGKVKTTSFTLGRIRSQTPEMMCKITREGWTKSEIEKYLQKKESAVNSNPQISEKERLKQAAARARDPNVIPEFRFEQAISEIRDIEKCYMKSFHNTFVLYSNMFCEKSETIKLEALKGLEDLKTYIESIY